MSDIKALKDELSECIRKVPARVNEASIQTATAYKKWAASAVKVLGNSRANEIQVQSMIQQHKGFR